MAKVIAPFQIKGTIDDLIYYIDQDNVNRVKQKGKTGVSSKEFVTNPIFTKARNHGKEFGKAVKKAQSFRMLAHYFNNRAKDGSYAGRVNKLMLNILNEDTTNEQGHRTVEKGMESEESKTFFLGFEGNKLRPLEKVLKTKWSWNEFTSEFTIGEFNALKHIDWPEKAEGVHIAIARTNWNYQADKFITEYSNEIIFKKEEQSDDLTLKTNSPEGQELHLVFLLIAFSTQDGKKVKELKRANNTVSIIWAN